MNKGKRAEHLLTKHRVVGILVGSMFLVYGIVGAILLAYAATGYAARPIRLFVNDREYWPDAAPTKVNGHIMVPLGLVSRALGGEVFWDAEAYTVRIYRRVAVGRPVLRVRETVLALKPVTVKEVIDGDTIRVAVQGISGPIETVRLAGINAPEASDLRGLRVGAYVNALIANRKVWLEVDPRLRDRHGRLLAYVWLEPPVEDAIDEVRRHMLNARLLLNGHARLSISPAHEKYATMFFMFERDAIAAGRDIWRR